MEARKWKYFLLTVHFLLGYALLGIAFIVYSCIDKVELFNQNDIIGMSFTAFFGLLIIFFQLLNLKMQSHAIAGKKLTPLFFTLHLVLFIANILVFIGIAIFCIFLFIRFINALNYPSISPKFFLFYTSWCVFTLSSAYNGATAPEFKRHVISETTKARDGILNSLGS